MLKFKSQSPRVLAMIVTFTLGAAGSTMAMARPADGLSSSAPKASHQGRGHPGEERRGNKRHRINHVFSSLDTNGDDLVTLDEFLVKPVEKAANLFDRVDTDDDGLISEEEFQAAAERRGERHPDVDRDAVRACAEEQLGEALPERPDPETRFDALDENGDGFINLDELTSAKTANAQDKFAVIDADGDGAITIEELAASLQNHRERREMIRSCVEEQLDETSLIGG